MYLLSIFLFVRLFVCLCLHQCMWIFVNVSFCVFYFTITVELNQLCREETDSEYKPTSNFSTWQLDGVSRIRVQYTQNSGEISNHQVMEIDVYIHLLWVTSFPPPLFFSTLLHSLPLPSLGMGSRREVWDPWKNTQSGKALLGGNFSLYIRGSCVLFRV